MIRGVILLLALHGAAAYGQSVSTVPYSVVGASGAIHVTFSVLPTKIRVGEYPWYRIELRNVGTKDLYVAEDIFDDPWKFLSDSGLHRVFQLEVVGPSGKRLFPTPRRKIRDPRLHNRPPTPPDPVQMRKDREDVARWRKQGLSDAEITERLNDPMKAPLPPYRPHIVKPGKTLATTPWHYLNPERQAYGWERPPGTDGFRELAIYEFEKPGRYKIRLSYDEDPNKALAEYLADSRKLTGERLRLREYILKSLRERAAHPGPLDVALPEIAIEIEVIS